MTHSHRTHSHKGILTLVIVCVLSACGDGSTPVSEEVDAEQNEHNNVSADQHNPGQSNKEPDISNVSGTLIIEERNGKTVFDAFFSHTAVSTTPDTSSMDEAVNTDTCRVTALQSKVIPNAPVALGYANGEIGDALTIESRVGQYEALIKQQFGDLTVYAPDTRWQSAPVPDDAVLSFATDSVMQQLGSVALPQLLPLVWLAPETGVMSNPATSLRWEASFDEAVRIRLRLSAIDFRDSQNPTVVTVSCKLVDDGEYSLPVEFQQQLPDDDMGIVVYAVRERVQHVQADNSSLTVIQLSYPSPM